VDFYHYGQIGDEKGLETQTRAQRQGDFTNNFHVSDRLWNIILLVPMRGIGNNTYLLTCHQDETIF
jgi:hypothetical protein